MKTRFLVIFTLSFILVGLQAQSPYLTYTYEKNGKEQKVEGFEDIEQCGTDERHAYLMKTDSEYTNNYNKHTRLLDSVLQSNNLNRSQLPPQYTIPVVVHVIHLGEPIGSGSNVSDNEVLQNITNLNNFFANSNGYGVNIEIDFCLANRDPNGCPTSGIMRVNGSSVQDYSTLGVEFNGNCGADEHAIKDLSKWPTLDYYNIWIVHDICGDIAGYANYPSGHPYDGTVVIRSAIGAITHELGHAFDLRHTFEGDNNGNTCPLNNNCLLDGDKVCDTPPHKRADCGTSNPCTSEGIWDNSRKNRMSYCGQPNQRFTQGQKDRMRSTLLVYPRENLLNSLGCDGAATPVITSSNAPICSGTTRMLTGTPTGGTFSMVSGPGTISNAILTATGGGTIVIKYVTCAGTATQSIVSNLTPTPTITSSNAPMCSGTTRVLTGTPTGGAFSVISGPGSISGNILTVTGAGTIIIQYSVTQNGCTGATTQSILSNQTPAPLITSSNAPICSGNTRTLIGTPTDGIFSMVSGPGTISGNTLTSIGAGTIVLQYTVTQNGCTGNTSQSIVSNLTPAPSITSSNSPMCSDETRTLTGTPTGGSYSVLSGPGTINGDILTANGAGTIIVQYSVTLNGCTGNTSQNIVSNQTPAPVITSSGDPICTGETRPLTGTPTGGVFSLISGPGNINGNVLTSIGVGTIIIQYSVTQNECSGAVSQSIVSNLTPDPLITSSNSPICSEETRILTAVPLGGEFDVISGPGLLSGNVLSSTGAGTIVIEYTLQSNGCVGTTTQNILSYQTPEPEITSDNFPMCSGETRLLTAVPGGGSFEVLSGPGALNGSVLTATGDGTISIQYAFTQNGCNGFTLQNINAYETPEPEFTSDDSPICSEDTRILTALPGGGNFEILSGPGELSGSILTATGTGNIVIEYYISENNCDGIVIQHIQSSQTPAPEIISDNSPMCSGDTRVIQTTPPGGDLEVLSGPGFLLGQVLTAAGNGPIQLRYTYTQNNCEAESLQTIQSYDTPDPYFTSDPDPMCSGETRILSATPASGIFTVVSGPGAIFGHELRSIGAGTITAEYEVTLNGCVGAITQSIESILSPIPFFTSSDSPMCYNETREITAEPSGGTISIASGPGILNENVLSSSGSGVIILQYTLTANGCTTSVTQEIGVSVDEPPMILSANSQICSGDVRELVGAPVGGIFTVLSGPATIENGVLLSIGGGVIELAYETCAGIATQEIVSLLIQTPIFISSDANMCVGENRDLESNIAGGIFTVVSGPGIVIGNTLTAIDSGNIEIAYTVMENGCTSSVLQSFISYEVPMIEVVQANNVLIASQEIGTFQWVDCETNFQPIPSEINHSFVVTMAGIYALVFSQNNCADTSACLPVSITAVKKIDILSSVKIYPNPTQGIVTIESLNTLMGLTIKIKDIFGKQIFKAEQSDSTKQWIDLSGLPSGAYFLEIGKDSNTFSTCTLIKL